MKFEQYLEDADLNKKLNQIPEDFAGLKKKVRPLFFDGLFNSKNAGDTNLNAFFIDELSSFKASKDQVYVWSPGVSSILIRGNSIPLNSLENSNDYFSFLEILDVDAASVEKIASLGFDGIFCRFLESSNHDLASVTLIFEVCKDYGIWSALDIFDERMRRIYFDSDISFSFLDVTFLKNNFGNEYEIFVAKLMEDFRSAKLESRVPRSLFLVDKKFSTSKQTKVKTEIVRIDI